MVTSTHPTTSHYDHHHQMPTTSSGMMSSSPHQIGSPSQQHYHSPSPYKQEIPSPGEYASPHQAANVDYIHPSGSPPYHHPLPSSVVPSTATSIPHLIPYTNVSTTSCGTSGLATTYFDAMTGEPAIYTMPGTHPHMSMVDSFTVQPHQLPPFTHAFEGAMTSHNGSIPDQSGSPLQINHVRNDYGGGVTEIKYYPPSPQMTVEGHPGAAMMYHDMCGGSPPLPPDLCSTSGLTPLPSHLMPTIRPRKSKRNTHTLTSH